MKRRELKFNVHTPMQISMESICHKNLMNNCGEAAHIFPIIYTTCTALNLTICIMTKFNISFYHLIIYLIKIK